MKEISRIASAVAPSATLAVDSLYKQMKAAGVDVVGFGAGEPDFDTPLGIKEAAIAAIGAGQTKYTPAAGLPSLRKAAAARLNADCALSYTDSQIVIASGAKHSLFVAIMSLLNPGDEVIIPAPYWVTYSESVAMAGGKPVIIYAAEDHRFKITARQLDEAVTPRTKLFILNNPSNPTGMLYDEDELRALADVCIKHDLYVIADEIYYSLVYDGKRFVSFASLGGDIVQRTILINGVSKSYAMTGWRVGYSASSRELADVMASYLSHSTSAPSTISQLAAVEALSGPQDSVVRMREAFRERRDYIVRRINSIDGISCLKPDGAFYAMLNMAQLCGRTLGGRVIGDSDDFSLALLEAGHVAVVSCTSFGTRNFCRLTYAASLETITEGLDRIERFVRG